MFTLPGRIRQKKLVWGQLKFWSYHELEKYYELCYWQTPKRRQNASVYIDIRSKMKFMERIRTIACTYPVSLPKMLDRLLARAATVYDSGSTTTYYHRLYVTAGESAGNPYRRDVIVTSSGENAAAVGTTSTQWGEEAAEETAHGRRMLPHGVDTDEDDDDVATVTRQRRICSRHTSQWRHVNVMSAL